MATQPGGVLIGIDSGGSYVKAAAFDLDSGLVVVEGLHVPASHPAPGHNERDPEALWKATAGVVRRVVAQVPSAADRIVAVGVTAHGNGLYLVDATGAPTHAAIQASDTRARAIVRRWEHDGVPDKLRATIWNGIWPGQPGPILAWLAEHEPEALESSSAALMCGDYLRARMTGQIHAELTTASCNGLFDSAARTYSAAALDAYGIRRWEGLLPEVAQPTDVVGVITAAAAEATGLPEGVPVVAGVVDNVGLHLGAGVLDGSRIVVGAGTWSINQLLVTEGEMTLAGPLGRVEPYAACLADPRADGHVDRGVRHLGVDARMGAAQRDTRPRRRGGGGGRERLRVRAGASREPPSTNRHADVPAVPRRRTGRTHRPRRLGRALFLVR